MVERTHFREMPSWRFEETHLTAEFELFVEREIWPQLVALHSGYKADEKQAVAAQITHALVHTGLTGRVVADPRDRADRAGRQRLAVWDAMIAARLCRACTGSQLSGHVTRYRATPALLDLRQLWELRLLERLRDRRTVAEDDDGPDVALVVVRSRWNFFTGQPLSPEEAGEIIPVRRIIRDSCLSHPEEFENRMRYWNRMEDLIETVNRTNLAHSWVAYRRDKETRKTHAFQVNPALRQVHAGWLRRAARFYTWGPLGGQSLPKKIRRTIEIDGEPAAEIDGAAYAPRLLYHLLGYDVEGDVYWPEKVFPRVYAFENLAPGARKTIRKFVKKATVICLNVQNRGAAVAAIAKALRDAPDRAYLTRAIFETEQTDLAGIIDRVANAHPEGIRERLFCQRGIDLMEIDGNIMKWILAELVQKRARPCLPIHDGLIVRSSDVHEAEAVFKSCYGAFTGGREPVLEREF